MNTSVIEAIERQKTTNLYEALKSIPDDKIRELVRLATFSPTAFHLQNWRFIAVRSPEAKARLRAVAADQPKVTEAAVTFIMVGELAVADVMADRLAGSVAAGFMPVGVGPGWGGAAKSLYFEKPQVDFGHSSSIAGDVYQAVECDAGEFVNIVYLTRRFKTASGP